MSKSMKTLHKSLSDQAREFKEILISMVTNLPDNSQKTPQGARCFSIKSSELSGILTVRHYDYAAQYREIAEQIQKANIEKIPLLFDRIMKDKRYHRTVRENIRKIW